MKFFACNCSSHVLGVDRFGVEISEDHKKVIEFPDVEFTIYQQPSCGTYTWKERLQHVWQIIRWGHPYGDFVLLDIYETGKLRDYLTELIVEWEMYESGEDKP